jgi:hypothetical protein
MELYDRYLAAIRRDLPADANGVGADDIVAELRDDLMTRVELREEALGRPLDKSEQEALLREFGRPIVVAARYREHQYLIGPETFPYYLGGLKVGALIVGIVLAVLIGVDLAFGTRDPWQAGAQAVSSFFNMAVTGFGIVTLIFALIERRGGVKSDADWKLDDLPSLDDLVRDSRKDAPIEIVFGALFVLWWFGVIPFAPIEWQQQFTVTPAPVWAELFWPIGLLVAARLAMSILTLAPSRVAPLRHALNVITAVAGVVIAVALFQAGHWIDLGPGTADAVQAGQIEESLNLAIRIALVVGVIMWTFAGLGGLWRLVRRREAGAV